MAFSTSFTYEAIDKITPTLKKMQEQSKKLEKVLNEAVKDPKLNADKLKIALSDAVGKPLPKAKKLNETLKQTSVMLKKAAKSTKDVGKSMTTHVTAPVIAGFTAIALAGGKYEDSLASLSAITGLQGKDLDSISSKILSMSNSFGIASTDIAAGMERIGSNQPELLSNPELLLKVGKSAIIMGKASGMGFNEAGDALTGIMNQFGITGKESDRVMNVLAAGQKLGSATIGMLSESMRNIGPSAKDAGLSIEQTVATMEVLASKGKKGAEAGTQLRNIFTRMSVEMGDKFNPKVVGLAKALENVGEMSDKKLLKQFGLENVNTIKILTQNLDKLDKLTTGVTNTSEANKAAEIRMKTFNESIKKLWQNIKNNLITVFMDNREMLKGLVADGMDAIRWVTSFVKNNKDLVRIGLKLAIVLASVGPVLIGLGAGISALSTIMGVGSTAMGAFALSAKTMTAAAVPMAAPILAAVAAIALLIKTWKELQDKDVQTGMAMWFADEEDVENLMPGSGGPDVKTINAVARGKRLRAQQQAAMGARAGGKSTVNVNVKSEGSFTLDGKKPKSQKTHTTAESVGTREDR